MEFVAWRTISHIMVMLPGGRRISWCFSTCDGLEEHKAFLVNLNFIQHANVRFS